MGKPSQFSPNPFKITSFYNFSPYYMHFFILLDRCIFSGIILIIPLFVFKCEVMIVMESIVLMDP